jgi:hypothetical protein
MVCSPDLMCARLVHHAQQVRAIVPRHQYLHEGKVARYGRHASEVLDLQDVHELVEVRGHALGADLVAIEHDRHARDARLGRPSDRQRLDVERTARSATRLARRLVFDEGHQCVMHTSS